MKSSTLVYARAGIIAGLYIVLALLTMPLSSGAVQVRISEVLTLLPLLFFEAIPALFIGCLLSNLISGLAILDVLLGSLVTLLSALLTFLTGRIVKGKALKIIVGGAFPVMLNAFILPLIWLLCYGATEYLYIIQVVIIFIGQALAVYLLGAPIFISVNKFQERQIK